MNKNDMCDMAVERIGEVAKDFSSQMSTIHMMYNTKANEMRERRRGLSSEGLERFEQHMRHRNALEIKIMLALLTSGDGSKGSLETRLRTSRGNLNRALERLERDGLVETVMDEGGPHPRAVIVSRF